MKTFEELMINLRFSPGEHVTLSMSAMLLSSSGKHVPPYLGRGSVHVLVLGFFQTLSVKTHSESSEMFQSDHPPFSEKQLVC